MIERRIRAEAILLRPGREAMVTIISPGAQHFLSVIDALALANEIIQSTMRAQVHNAKLPEQDNP